MKEVGYLGEYVKVAVITDPQLMDKTTRGLAPKSFALEISQFYTDLFMRRAFLASILPFNPDVILFLGDYFDGGPILSNEEWQESLNRFKHIFDLNTKRRNTNIQLYYLPGNHDVGYASFHSYRPEVFDRYEKYFGTRNFRFTVGKVEFIALDAQTLDGHRHKSTTSASWDFVKNVSMDLKLDTRVLLTHIPLYRPDWTSCGPYRSSPPINQRVTHAVRDQDILYQNYITEESSNYLLELIRPVLILSGHDHDQCTVTHKSKYGAAIEHTVGTISWQQGNIYPSFMLLSASNQNTSHPEDAVSTHLCFLPVQLHIYIWYISLFVITLVVLILWPVNGMHFSFNVVGYTRRLINSTKEKNEDEKCEYEEIWDAEGSMHLIKKTSKSSLTNSTQRSLVERGNAVMRSVAKKQTPQEVSLSVDVEEDAMVKLPCRTSRSRTRLVIGRFVRVFRSVTFIAAVNIPLYIMLLFKDWIDI